MSNRPKALVLEAPGINCNLETAFAIEQAGGEAEQVHISELRSGKKRLADYAFLALSGGFSHGDAIRSGAILGLELRKRFGDELNDFVADGRPVIGICNGFQVLVESGLLPDGKIDEAEPKTVSLIGNESGKFECRWVHLAVAQSACRFVRPSAYPVMLPVAHAEGRFVAPNHPLSPNQIVYRYVNEQRGRATYPANPNGSPNGTAGITDPSGVVLGLMPHPERYVRRTQHPTWRTPGHAEMPYGTELFEDLIKYAKEL